MTPPDGTAQLQSELVAAQRASRCPSIAATVLVGGATLWSGAAGSVTGRPDGAVATPDTSYRIGSLTKTVTAITVLQQLAAGLLDLDAPIGEVLPELAPDIAAASARSLLTHGSGLLAEPAGPWWERSAGRTWQQLLHQVHRNPDLTGRFHYSNTGYAILGQLVCRLARKPWWDVVRDDVLTPLGMDHTTYDAPEGAAPGLAVHPDADLLHAEPTHDSGAMAPAGQLWSTVADVGLLGEFLRRGDDAVLRDALRARMLVPALVDDVPGQPWTRAYGCGVDVTDRSGIRYVGHGGSMPGFVASLRVQAERAVTVAVLANSTAGHGADLAYRLLDLAATSSSTQQPWSAADTGQYCDLVGRWFWGPRPYVLRARPDGGLDLTPGDAGRGAHFIPCGPDTWLGRDEYFAGETLRVVRRGNRSTYLDLGTLRFTRAPYDPRSDIPGGVDPAGWQ